MAINHPSHIAIIIATYNRPDALERVLAGCLSQTDLAFEIIVADDGSRNDTRETIDRIARSTSISLRHVWHPDNGFRLSEIRNRGVLAASEADYVVFLDGDCVPRNDFVARHRALAQRGFWLSGSRILIDETLTRDLVTRNVDLHSASKRFWFRAWRAGHINKFLPLLIPGLPAPRAFRSASLRGIKGCNLGVWRDDFEHVNGFDQSFVGWGHEDADLAVRLYNAGVRRKRGFCATEVFHLWHREQSRAQESPNYQRMLARRNTDITRAEIGLAELRAAG
ncbi:glycosyltransferase family 2 protein [Ralstonia sp. ASV6]|uniref:glycosyltransferase family 2 protein n=1 Tax=Ralstonia sp. ASV6 TaxID=2795124 RepID=UPI0018EBD568|nr:glycosyltransferase family 2 protein [Ralstonia sp. ASV6]